VIWQVLLLLPKN